ncbi:unnamed protein product, partial [Mesorhabditis spiculigera]
MIRRGRYGKVYTVWVCAAPVVNIGDYETILQVLVRDGAINSKRYEAPFLCVARTDKNDGHVYGTMMANGQIWEEHRKFTLRVLKQLGVGRGIIEDRILDELDYQTAEIDKRLVNNNTATLEFNRISDLFVGNTINSILFGYRFDEENYAKFHAVKAPLDDAFASMTGLHNFMPDFIKYIPVLKRMHQHIIQPQERVLEFAIEEVKKRVESIKEGTWSIEGEPHDFLDAYLQEQELVATNQKTWDTFSDFALYNDIVDIWTAGQETTSLTLNWAFILLTRHPDVIEKCRAEVLALTHGHRHINMVDRDKTPYMNATITEIMRRGHILNLNMARETTVDCKFGAYTVSAGTVFTPNASLVLMDEAIFEDPEKFCPERFVENPKLEDS